MAFYQVPLKDLQKYYPNLQVGNSEGDMQFVVQQQEPPTEQNQLAPVEANTDQNTGGANVQRVYILEESGDHTSFIMQQDANDHLILPDGRVFVTLNKETPTLTVDQETQNSGDSVQVIQHQRPQQKQMIVMQQQPHNSQLQLQQQVSRQNSSPIIHQQVVRRQQPQQQTAQDPSKIQLAMPLQNDKGQQANVPQFIFHHNQQIIVQHQQQMPSKEEKVHTPSNTQQQQQQRIIMQQMKSPEVIETPSGEDGSYMICQGMEVVTTPHEVDAESKTISLPGGPNVQLTRNVKGTPLQRTPQRPSTTPSSAQQRPLIRLQWNPRQYGGRESPQRPPKPCLDSDEPAADVREQLSKIMAALPEETRRQQTPNLQSQLPPSATPKKSPAKAKAAPKSTIKAPAKAAAKPRVRAPAKTPARAQPKVPPQAGKSPAFQQRQQMVFLLPNGKQIIRVTDPLNSPMSVSQLLHQVGVDVADNAHVDMQSFLSGSPGEISVATHTPQQQYGTQLRGTQTQTPNRRKVVIPVVNLPRPQTPQIPTNNQQPKEQQQLMHQQLFITQRIPQGQIHEQSSSTNLKTINPMMLPFPDSKGPLIAVQNNLAVKSQQAIEQKQASTAATIQQEQADSSAVQTQQQPGNPAGGPSQVGNITNCNALQQSQQQRVGNSTSPRLQQQQEPQREGKVLAGFVAICPFCGICNFDLTKCDRCKRRLPDTVKIRPLIPKKECPNSPGPMLSHANLKTPGDEKMQVEDNFENDKKKDKSPKKKKKPEEPVVLVLSSDEEDGGGDSGTIGSSSETPNSRVVNKEPVYTSAEMGHVWPEPDAAMPEESDGPFTMMVHKSTRVGNFKSELRDRFIVSSAGVQFTAHSAVDGEVVKVFIKKSALKAVLVLYSRTAEPLILLYPTRAAAARVRALLGVNNEAFFYYDPCSSVQAFRRLIINIEKLTEENKTVLASVLEGLLTEIDEAEKDNIMARALTAPPPAPSTRTILTFEKLELTNTDYACLAEETYINDVIIDFYLQYLCLRVLSPADRARTHVFSSYFYNRLTKKLDRRECSKDSPAEKRHKRVRRWTKKTNLFEKDFIIIPINENSHWFLAVICFPNLESPVNFSDNTPVPVETSTPTKTAASRQIVTQSPAPSPSNCLQIGNTTITHCKVENSPRGITVGTDSDRDEAEAEDELSDEESEGDEQQTEANGAQPIPSIPLLGPPDPQPSPKAAPKRQTPTTTPIKQPCILIFDSLRGSNPRARVVATLRDFLKIEYKWKTGEVREFTKDNFKGAVLKVPQQNNYFDCGLFVLQYVESFFQKPLTDYRLPIRYLNDWFSEELTRNKRQDVASLIQSLMLEQGVDPRTMNLPDLACNTAFVDPTEFEEDAEMTEGKEDELEEGEEFEVEEEEEEEEDDDDDEEFMGEQIRLRALGQLGGADDEEREDEDGFEEGELPIHADTDSDVGSSEEVENSRSTLVKKTYLPEPSWAQTNVAAVHTLLQNHIPADGQTRQTLKSIRIQRGNQTNSHGNNKSDQPLAKRPKAEITIEVNNVS